MTALLATSAEEKSAAPDDLALIKATLGGDEQAFSALAERYQGPLYQFLLLHAQSHADVQDALQETWLAVHRHLGTFDKNRHFSTWLYTIALRKLPRTNRPPVHGAPAQQCVGPLERVLEAEEQDNVWVLARRLMGAEQLSALWFFYACDLSVTEIGSILGRSDSWVKINLYRARALLRQNLDQTIT